MNNFIELTEDEMMEINAGSPEKRFMYGVGAIACAYGAMACGTITLGCALAPEPVATKSAMFGMAATTAALTLQSIDMCNSGSKE